MKIIIFLFSAFFTHHVFANNLIVDGTRFIYHASQSEITIGITNTANRAAIAQSWLDNGNPGETAGKVKTPFRISPPIARVEPNGKQILRIKLISAEGLPTYKESLWWLNILDIPALSKSEWEDTNFLHLAIRSRFKFIYRPIGIGTPPAANQYIKLTAKKQQLKINNMSPFYTTLTKISINGKESLNLKPIMVAPFSCTVTQLTKRIKAGTNVMINTLNDYGAEVTSTLEVK